MGLCSGCSLGAHAVGCFTTPPLRGGGTHGKALAVVLVASFRVSGLVVVLGVVCLAPRDC